MQSKKESKNEENKTKKIFLNALAAILSIAFWIIINISIYLTLSFYLPKSGQIIFVFILFAQIMIGGPALILWHADFEKSVAPVPKIPKNARIEWWQT